MITMATKTTTLPTHLPTPPNSCSSLLTILAVVVILRSRKVRTRREEEREAELVVEVDLVEVELIEVSQTDGRGAAEEDGPPKSDRPTSQQDDVAERRLQDLTVKEVAMVLHTVGFGAYAKAFSEQNISGQDLVYFRSPDELLTCGVETLVSYFPTQTIVTTTTRGLPVDRSLRYPS